MSENKFWIIVWSIIVSGIVSIIAIIAGYNAYEQTMWNAQLTAGHDPMSLRCAKTPSSALMDSTCAMWMLKGTK